MFLVDLMNRLIGHLFDRVTIKGHIVAELRDSNGVLKQREEIHNLVTDNGDKYIAEKLYSSPTLMTNMKLCTDNVVATKSGAGSYPGTNYINGSAHACDESSPKVGGTADEVDYIHTWAAGEATATIRRVAITDNVTNAAEGDATHTLAMGVFGADIVKGANDTLKVTWGITMLGA